MANPLATAVYGLPFSKNKDRKYSQYNNLVYLAVIGKTAAAIRKESELKKGASVAAFLSYTEREKIKEMQIQVAGLMRQGKSYHEIKEIVIPPKTKEE